MMVCWWTFMYTDSQVFIQLLKKSLSKARIRTTSIEGGKKEKKKLHPILSFSNYKSYTCLLRNNCNIKVNDK